jgi:hypothetical protein
MESPFPLLTPVQFPSFRASGDTDSFEFFVTFEI